MKTILSSVALTAAVLSAAPVQAQRADVNFAFGGATTNTANALDAFAAGNPQLAGLVAGIRASGLDIIGLEQELDFATATINDVDPAKDVFWVYAGINNYLAGGQNPTVPTAEIGAALDRLYNELGARRFVVPNLPAIGDLPLFSASAGFPQQVRDGLTGLTYGHNAILGGVIAGFVASHPGADVVTADVFSVFQGHKFSGQYANVVDGCDVVNAGQDLTNPATCAGFLYLDIVHPRSSAWAPVAESIATSLAAGGDVDRIITLGDSFSDAGSESDTFLRTLGFPFPFPPFTGGRFTEAENVVQQAEALVGTLVQTTAFSQPLVTAQTATATATASVSGNVFVPKQFAGVGQSKVKLTFTVGCEEIACTYAPNGQGAYVLAADKGKHGRPCHGKAEGGDLLDASNIKIKIKHGDSVTISWLHY